MIGRTVMFRGVPLVNTESTLQTVLRVETGSVWCLVEYKERPDVLFRHFTAATAEVPDTRVMNGVHYLLCGGT